MQHRGDSLKRAFDFVLASFIIIIFFPVLTGIWLLVLVRMGNPAIFRQKRPGMHGHPFQMYKFRTMNDKRGQDSQLLPDADRITALGRFMRSTSLDELPELWNVVTGEMSLVGPRPLLTEYLTLYSPEQARRHEVRPGITGWAQVNGRNALTWDQKFEHDVWYVDNRSFMLDMRKVIQREGIAAAGDATMPKFRGRDGAD
jgi:sugar transferase EpsL